MGRKVPEPGHATAFASIDLAFLKGEPGFRPKICRHDEELLLESLGLEWVNMMQLERQEHDYNGKEWKIL